MKKPIVIKDEKWKWLDESHPVNDYIRELHKYIDYLEAEAEKLPISNVSIKPMTKQNLLLAAEMLELASEVFANHGSNDLGKKAKEIITDPEKLCEEMRSYLNDPEWPEDIDDIGDDTLMEFLSHKLKKEADK